MRVIVRYYSVRKIFVFIERCSLRSKAEWHYQQYLRLVYLMVSSINAIYRV
jgi:hypothetical protein